ncbi:MAG: TIM barrel protein [Knoellia sp.]
MSRRDTWSDHLGLCSVTLRHLSAQDVIGVTRAAGLRGIEWGADVHVPPSDPGRVAEVRELTRAAGLTVASYGSYWRAGSSPMPDLRAVVQTGSTLGAPRVRVWAGALGTEAADDPTRDAVVAALREGCVMARDHDLQLALEFHPNTLTDSVDGTLELLERVGDSGLQTYWQPRLDEETEPSVEGLRRLVPVLAGIHVFSWWPAANRLRLSERADLWSAVASLLTSEAEPCDLLLEFVRGDDPDLVSEEASTLRDLFAAARP